MSVNKELRWLRAPGLKGTAKRFADFCKTDIPQQARTDSDFDIGIYNDAAKLITKRLQASSSRENVIKGAK